jgi:hypothetical protein
VLIVMSVALLTGTLGLHAQSRTATTALVLQVRQEELLQVQTDQVALKIRLARGRTAQVWVANSCTSPMLESLTITQSGTYTVPLATIGATTSDSPGGIAYVCLLSSDGVLQDSVSIRAVAPEDSVGRKEVRQLTGVDGASAPTVAAPVLTTQAGTTTESNP